MFILAAEGKIELASRFGEVNLIQEEWGSWKIKKLMPGKIDSREWNQENFLNAVADLLSAGE